MILVVGLLTVWRMWKCWTAPHLCVQVLFANWFWNVRFYGVSSPLNLYPFASLIHGYPLPLLRLKNGYNSLMLSWQLILIDLIEWFEMIFYHLATPTHLQTCLFVEYCYITWYLFDFWGFILQQYVDLKSQENNISPFWYVDSSFKHPSNN